MLQTTPQTPFWEPVLPCIKGKKLVRTLTKFYLCLFQQLKILSVLYQAAWAPARTVFTQVQRTAAVTLEFWWILEVSGSWVQIFGLDYRHELSSWLYLNRKTFLALVSAQCLKAMEHITLWGNPYGVMGNRKEGRVQNWLCFVFMLLAAVTRTWISFVGSWDFLSKQSGMHIPGCLHAINVTWKSRL